MLIKAEQKRVPAAAVVEPWAKSSYFFNKGRDFVLPFFLQGHDSERKLNMNGINCVINV